ncbi:MAG: hypothetical protein EXR75_03400 [Myxococcales bacterium]|nr:hypothetical protein [Myxococcales bacterium]
MPSEFTPVTDASVFRKLAAAMWRAPNNPSIYGSLDVDATAALALLERLGARSLLPVASCQSLLANRHWAITSCQSLLGNR